jgi:hypothetical protein
MPQTILDLLNKAAQANITDNFRHGNVIHLPAEGSLIATGDIHGHRRNFERIVKFADLQNNPDRHVVLQEIIHGGPQDSTGGCLSYKLLFDAARYKISFPDRIHIIMGNHDTAFISSAEVMKDGKEMNRALCAALQQEFQQAYQDIKLALKELLFSQPLAVRCENRIWISHSLPDNRYSDKFDPAILNQPLKESDCEKPGSAYLLTWGRKHNQALLDKVGELFDADIFVLGHQHQQQGWSRPASNLLIIASDHNHGCLLQIDLAGLPTMDKLLESIVPLAAIP